MNNTLGVWGRAPMETAAKKAVPYRSSLRNDFCLLCVHPSILIDRLSGGLNVGPHAFVPTISSKAILRHYDWHLQTTANYFTGDFQ